MNLNHIQFTNKIGETINFKFNFSIFQDLISIFSISYFINYILFKINNNIKYVTLIDEIIIRYKRLYLIKY